MYSQIQCQVDKVYMNEANNMFNKQISYGSMLLTLPVDVEN